MGANFGRWSFTCKAMAIKTSDYRAARHNFATRKAYKAFGEVLGIDALNKRRDVMKIAPRQGRIELHIRIIRIEKRLPLRKTICTRSLQPA